MRDASVLRTAHSRPRIRPFPLRVQVLTPEGKPLQVWAHGADPADNVETPAHVPTPPSAAQISAADALFATALRSDEPDGFGDFSDEFLENFGV